MSDGQFFAAELAAIFAAVVFGSLVRWELIPMLRERWEWHREAHAQWVAEQRDAAIRQALAPRRRP